MLSVEDQQAAFVGDMLSRGVFMQQMLDTALRNEPSQLYTGVLRCSGLNWKQSPEKQLENQKKHGLNRSTIELARYSALGNVLHSFMQKVFDQQWGTEGAYPEYEINLEDPHKIRGTLDRLQMGSPIGNVLIEMKTTDTVQKDGPGAEYLASKLFDTTHLYKNWLQESPDIEKLRAEVVARSQYKLRDIKPKEEHLCQMSTYAYLLKYMLNVPVDYMMLVYISRSDLKITEFSYAMDMPEGQYLVHRAYENWQAVKKLLDEEIV